MKYIISIITIFIILISCDRETSKINDMGTLNIINAEKQQSQLKETYTLTTDDYFRVKRGAPSDETVMITSATGTIANLFGITSGYVKFNNIEEGRSWDYPYLHIDNEPNNKSTLFPVDKELTFTFYEEDQNEKVWRYTAVHVDNGVERPIKIEITSKKK